MVAVGFVAGIWLLLHPATFWLKPWRTAPVAVAPRFVFGPYPAEADFKDLDKRGVTTVISLLDRGRWHERVLLTRETELAHQHHMQVLDIPIASGGNGDLANSRTAADAALATEGTIYVHGYFGSQRADNVRLLLLQARTPDYSAAAERIKAAYAAGRMEDVLKEAANLHVAAPDIRSLEGWANYRLNRIDEALGIFSLLTKDRPDALDAATGLGYCELRKGNLEEAGRQFEKVTTQTQEYTTAVEGLGYVRYRQGRADEARALFVRVLAENPGNVEVRDLLNKLGDGTKSPVAPAPAAPVP